MALHLSSKSSPGAARGRLGRAVLALSALVLTGPAEVRMEDGHLVLDYNPRHLGDLEHWSHDVFRAHWRHQIFDMQPMTLLQVLARAGRLG